MKEELYTKVKDETEGEKNVRREERKDEMGRGIIADKKDEDEKWEMKEERQLPPPLIHFASNLLTRVLYQIRF
jgi:hypothetical protein